MQQGYWQGVLQAFAALMLALALASPVGAADQADLSPELQAAFAPSVQIVPGAGQDDLLRHIRFAKGIEGELTPVSLVDRAATEGGFAPATVSNYGSPGSRVVLTLSVTNAGDVAGRWNLTSERSGLPEISIAEVDDTAVRIVRSRTDPDIGEHLRIYHGLTHVFELDPGETKYFAISFTGFHSSFMPLSIQDPVAALQRQHLEIATIAASVAGMVMLILIAALFYGVTGAPHFLWLAIGEFVHALFIVHVNGYSIHYYLHDKGDWIYAIGWTLPCMYGLAVAQFTRGLLETKKEFPRLDLFLKALIALLLLTLIMFIFATATSIGWLMILASYPYLVGQMVYTFGLPIVGLIATLRYGARYSPLMIAWTIMALFNTYAIVASRSYVPNLPFDWNLYGPVGVLVSLLLTLTLVLHMRQVVLEQQQSRRELIVSLEDRLKLSEDKANALATINDQDHMIHASGHDSQQVMLALNAIVDFAESDERLDLPAALTQTLKASVRQLEDIADTTMAGPFSTGDSLSLVMLGRFALRDVLRQTEMIYRPILQKKGLLLSISDPGDTKLISDRAMCARILSNLLNNCAKYTERGSVSIETDVADGDLTITFSDTGCGMDPEFVDRLLAGSGGRLRADDTTHGSGSGFAAAQKAAGLLGGTLAVESEQGVGTSVSVTIPMISRAEECSIRALSKEAERNSISVVEADNLSAEELAKLSTDTGGHLAITSDPTASARGRLVSFGPVALLKPVSLDMLEHPLVKQSHLQAKPMEPVQS